MKLMTVESKRYQRVHIKQINHGKLARISCTSLLVRMGAFSPALRTGNPVIGSCTILTRRERFLLGVNTIRPLSILASRGSPARISSRRRSGPGSTTWPFVETVVCMVRLSYHTPVWNNRSTLGEIGTRGAKRPPRDLFLRASSLPTPCKSNDLRNL